MSQLSAHARKPLALLHSFAIKRVIKQFATKYHFVYFGFVDARDDEHELVRGVTSATGHVDNHYTVGAFQGRDITVVVRRNKLTFPGRPDVTYDWLIMQFDLRRSGQPHIFIDAHHHDATFYANFALVHTQLQNISAAFAQSDAAFAKHFKAFADTRDFPRIQAVLTPEVTATLSKHFHQFDYEINDDYLLVYASNSLSSLQLLNDMLRIGMWFSAHLDK